MAMNYVKFIRGTPEAFKKLKIKDKDTLYFISETDSQQGSLYLGNKIISESTVNLEDLNDLLLGDSILDKDILSYDAESGKWTNKPIISAINIMTGADSGNQGGAGLVPAPGIGQQNHFLRGDGVWAPVNVESNFIKSVDGFNFTVTEAGQLNLKTIEVAQVADLQSLLDTKVNKQYTENADGSKTEWILLSPENQTKLAALTVGDNGNLEVSSKVNADNVEGLGSWIATNRNITNGLYPEADRDKLASIESGAQKNYITAVNGNQLAVENGTLSILKVAVGSIEGLDSILPPFSAVSGEFSIIEDNGVKTLNLANSYIKTSTYLTEVGDINQLIHTTDNSTIVDEINNINLRLQWSEID